LTSDANRTLQLIQHDFVAENYPSRGDNKDSSDRGRGALYIGFEPGFKHIRCLKKAPSGEPGRIANHRIFAGDSAMTQVKKHGNFSSPFFRLTFAFICIV